jgi:hypothetical protein
MPKDDEDFLKSLFLDLNNKVDGHHRCIENKLSELIGSLEKRFSEVEDRVLFNEKKVSEHGHYFSMLKYVLTGGVATIVGFITWITQIFPFGHK